ncbi:Atypical/ABC1 protein kinase [Phytophthora cinnamomi]|uniref:Atypical/ABC1 protein kinase n=1 Tax=Phytophthora cinnamomi TaxID=4785 RepID=UPI00355A3127|nr:Atypical/ABC1 protein kinase [Phytophthora cinnamomi]
MTSRLLSGRSRRSLAALALLSGGAYVVDKANSNVLTRSMRVIATGGQVVWDYRRHFKGIEREDPDYRPKLQGLNQRIAQRLLHLCFQNGGVYTKFGQQLATFNHGLPKEYTETLAQLQDRAKPVSFEKAIQTIEAEMGRPWQEVFKEFDRRPIASASLAQVHHAVDHHGRELAVKVQYPHLESQMKADIRVIKWAFQLTEYFFPDVQIQWLYPEFKRALLSELDFENEKNNSRRIAACLKRNMSVHVPVVYDDLSTKRMMSMEFIAAPKISEIGAIEELGLNPPEVARALCEVFSEMKIAGRLDASMSESERKALSEDLKSMRFSNITDFLEQLPRDMLFVFRTNNMIRALNKELGGTTRERFSIMGDYAVSGHSAFYSGSREEGFIRVWGSLSYWWEHLNLVFRLRVLDYVMAAIQYAKGEPPAKLKRVG